MDGEGGAFLIFIRQFFPRFFPTLGKNEGFLGRKRSDFLIFFTFQLSFSSSSYFFPRNARFFPKSRVFRGSCGKRIVLPWFSQYFCSVEETRQRRNGSVILKHLLHYIIMNAQIMRVVKQGEAFAVQSQKSENGQMMKCNIILQEMGGKYENQQ